MLSMVMYFMMKNSICMDKADSKNINPEDNIQ